MLRIPQPPPEAVAPPLPPHIRPYDDDELTLALKPLVWDYLYRTIAARQEHGPDAAEMLAAARLSRFYSIVLAACEMEVNRYRRGAL